MNPTSTQRRPERFSPAVLGSISLLLVVAFAVSGGQAAVFAAGPVQPGGCQEARPCPRPVQSPCRIEREVRDQVRPDPSRSGPDSRAESTRPVATCRPMVDAAKPAMLVRDALLSLPPPGR